MGGRPSNLPPPQTSTCCNAQIPRVVGLLGVRKTSFLNTTHNYRNLLQYCVSSSCLPLRQVEQRDDRRLPVIGRVLGHDLLHSSVVLVREVEERRLVVVRGVLVLLRRGVVFRGGGVGRALVRCSQLVLRFESP